MDNPSYQHAKGRASFYRILREVRDGKYKRAYIKNQKGRATMTLTRSERRVELPLIEVTSEWFKANFSTAMSLVEHNFAFAITSKGNGTRVIARRYSRVTSPADAVIARWIDAVAKQAVLLHGQHLKDVIGDLHEKIEEVDEKIESVFRAVARLAIGPKLPDESAPTAFTSGTRRTASPPPAH